jgi:hypothetical protein
VGPVDYVWPAGTSSFCTFFRFIGASRSLKVRQKLHVYWLRRRVETKTPFFVFAKSENKRKFALVSRKFSRKIFVTGMVFAKILGNIHQCSDLVTHSSGSWIRISNGKFSRKLSRNRKFSQNLFKKRTFLQKFSQLFVCFFREKRKKIFAKIRIRKFSFQPYSVDTEIRKKTSCLFPFFLLLI